MQGIEDLKNAIQTTVATLVDQYKKQATEDAPFVHVHISILPSSSSSSSSSSLLSSSSSSSLSGSSSLLLSSSSSSLSSSSSSSSLLSSSTSSSSFSSMTHKTTNTLKRKYEDEKEEQRQKKKDEHRKLARELREMQRKRLRWEDRLMKIPGLTEDEQVYLDDCEKDIYLQKRGLYGRALERRLNRLLVQFAGFFLFLIVGFFFFYSSLLCDR